MTKSENEIVVVGSGGAELARWALPSGPVPDLAVVHELARLALSARRLGCRVRLHNACPRVLELLDLAGLRVEMVGDTEGGEEIGVEKIVMPDDPVA